MAKKMWGGRFEKKTDPLVEEFTRSIDYDHKLARYDVFGSILHVLMLKKSKLISVQEASKLSKALRKIYRNIESKKFRIDKNCEDIHTNIQNVIEKDIGELALKLHTARSRNDQVLIDLKLFCNAELNNIEGLCVKFIDSIKKVSKAVKGVIVPGYTHMQHAQLVYLSDYLGSYAEMLTRDHQRLESVKNNIRLYLGSGALAGTPVEARHYNAAVKEYSKIKEIAKIFNLKYCTSVSNSIDTISDRDFVIETLSALSILGMHLSRLSEDLILWSTKEFGFVEMDDAFATGSSLMPQKKNPDVLELVRGYTGTLYGNLVSVMTMMKGLPLTYNRDMQLDKPPLFSSFEIIEKELKVLAKLVKVVKWNKKAIAEKIRQDETIYATDLVYFLVKKGLAFKKAHDVIGMLVRESMETGGKIRNMTDAELARFSDKLTHNGILKIMNPAGSVKSRVSIKR